MSFPIYMYNDYLVGAYNITCSLYIYIYIYCQLTVSKIIKTEMVPAVPV